MEAIDLEAVEDEVADYLYAKSDAEEAHIVQCLEDQKSKYVEESEMSAESAGLIIALGVSCARLDSSECWSDHGKNIVAQGSSLEFWSDFQQGLASCL